VFAGDSLFTIRAYDGPKPPKLRSAPMTDSLNKIVGRLVPGDQISSTVEPSGSDSAGVFLLWVAVPSAGYRSALVRITAEDAVMEHSRGDTAASAESIAMTWQTALARALRAAVPDSAAGGGS